MPTCHTCKRKISPTAAYQCHTCFKEFHRDCFVEHIEKCGVNITIKKLKGGNQTR